jgi:hypothetical protein
MSPDAELMLIFGTLHLIAVALGVVLFVMFLRSETTQPWKPPDEDDGGGGNDRVPGRPKTSPSGGIPLPDAVQPHVRLRSHERLADLKPGRERRPSREPERRPVRAPQP